MLSFIIHFCCIVDKGCYDIVEKHLKGLSTNDRNVSVKDSRGAVSNITDRNVTTK